MRDGSGLEITVVCNDERMVEVRIVAASGSFRGGTEVYTEPDWLLDLSDRFRGFPKSREDRFRVEVGEPGLAWATIEAFGFDASGHVALALRVTDGPLGRLTQSRPQGAEIVFPFEPAAADRFANELAALARALEGSAMLQGTPDFR